MKAPTQAAADEPLFTETEQVIIREVLQQNGVIPNERDGVRVEHETSVERGRNGGGKGMPSMAGSKAIWPLRITLSSSATPPVNAARAGEWTSGKETV